MIRCRLAFVVALLTAPAGSLVGAQQSELKDPGTAQSYAFRGPGGGYFYTGEYVRGAAMLGAGAYAGLQMVKTFTCGSTVKSDYSYSGNCPAGGVWLWLGVLAVPYVYGILDASASAGRVNAKVRTSSSRFSPFVGSAPHGRMSVGLSVRSR